MKKILSLALIFTMLLSLTLVFTSCAKIDSKKDLENVKSANKLKVGMECNYAPFNWTQAEKSDTSVAISNSSGYADGYDVQCAKKIADALGVELEIVKLDWEGLVPALTSGKIDMIIAGMSPTEDRRESIDFSDQYYTSELVVVVKSSSPYVNAKSINDFEGAKITGQLDTFHYEVIDQMKGVSKQTALSDFPAMIVSLESGKIDGYISELPGAVSAVKSNSDLTFVAFTEENGFKSEPENVAVAVGIRKESTLTSEINKVLASFTLSERKDLMDWAIENQPVTED